MILLKESKTPKANKLYTAHELGLYYINDDLNINSQNKIPLKIISSKKNSSDFGRNSNGWFVKSSADYVQAIANLDIEPGNRSIFAKLDFISTQTGITDGEHGLYEIILIHNDEWIRRGCLPMRIRIDNSKFYILDIHSNLIAGDDKKKVFFQKVNVLYTITVVLFEKSVYASLSGFGIPDGSVYIGVKDCKRYIPGFPGFGLKANAQTTEGKAFVKNWIVSPVGPYKPILGVIGDSITAGATEKPECESYVHIITRALGQQLTLNVGSGGANSFMNLKRFPIEIAPFKPYITWIEPSINDILMGASFENIYRCIIGQINLITWQGMVLLSTVQPCNILNENQIYQRNKLNELIRNSGMPFVDKDIILRDTLKKDELNNIYNNGDGIHINIEAHRFVAIETIKILKLIIK